MPQSERPNFQDALDRKRPLNNLEITILFNYSITIREQELKLIYKTSWNKLLPMERLMIEDAYFNGARGLVGSKTSFYRNMIKLVKTREELGIDYENHIFAPQEDKFDPEDLIGHEKYLYNALWELQCNSNPDKHGGIQNRREKELMAGNSYKFPKVVCPPRAIKEAAIERGEITLSELQKKVPDSYAMFIESTRVSLKNKFDEAKKINEICGVIPEFDDFRNVTKISFELVRDYDKNTKEIIYFVKQKVESAVVRCGEKGASEDDLLCYAQLEATKFLARHRRMASGLLNQFSSILTKLRQESFGITHYIWRTCLDQKVRDSHFNREGIAFSWEEAPSDGHSGMTYNCRCFAEPVSQEESTNLESAA